jgi:glycerol-1-phosphate dehydrogenase [NAD(P)+]
LKVRHSEEKFYDPNWQRPEVVYGNRLIDNVVDHGERFAVATMEIPWNLVKDAFPARPEAVVFVRDMELDTLQSLEKTVPPVDMVVGIGGGSSHDSAKYLALKKKARLVQIPTILSADAAVTSAIGIREKGRVKYIGHVIADRILVDFSLIKRAPEELVRYGAADILSSHTATFDWKLASEKGKEKFDQTFYDKAHDLLATLEQRRFDIKEVNDEGIRTIVELYLGYAEIAEKLQSDRAQEGSEHFYAYNVEHVTKKQYVHGKLLGTGIVLMSHLQNNEPDKILRLTNDMGFETKLAATGLGRQDFSEVLETLKHFTEETGYYYSIINETRFDRPTIETLHKMLS